MTKPKTSAEPQLFVTASPAPSLRTEPHLLPTIAFASDGCVMAHWHGIMIVIWGTAATLPLVDELSKLAESIGETYSRASSVHLVVNNAGPPTSEARSALWGLTKRSESRHICTAAWVEGTGFWASLISSLVTSLDLVTGRRLKLRSFTDLERLADWVIQNHARALGLQLSAAELVQALSWVRDQAAAYNEPPAGSASVR